MSKIVLYVLKGSLGRSAAEIHIVGGKDISLIHCEAEYKEDAEQINRLFKSYLPLGTYRALFSLMEKEQE